MQPYFKLISNIIMSIIYYVSHATQYIFILFIFKHIHTGLALLSAILTS